MVDAHRYVYAPDFEPITVLEAPIFSANDGWTIDTWRRMNFDWLAGAVKKLGDGKTEGAKLRNVLGNPTYTVEMLPTETVQTGRKEDALRLTVRATGGRVSTEHYSMAIVLLPSK